MLKRLAVMLLVVILFAPLALLGAEINSSWEALAGMAKIGRKVQITRMNMASLRGKLVSIGNESITIQQRGGSQAIPREDVFQVRYARAHPVLLGVLIGAVTGAVSLWAVDRSSDKPKAGEAVGLGIFLGSGVGAIAGAWLPDPKTLFQAPKPPRAR